MDREDDVRDLNTRIRYNKVADRDIISSTSPYQLFATYIWGHKFYLSSKQELIEAMFASNSASLSFASVRLYLLVNIFGAESSRMKASSAAVEEVHCCFKKHMQENECSKLISNLLDIIQEDGANLVSFSESMVDENPWERLSNPKVISKEGISKEKEDRLTVEVDIFALIRNFVGLVTLRSLMGTDWADSQSAFMSDLSSFDDGWPSMLMGLPRWLPIPGLSKAYIARRSLCKSLTAFHQAMDNDAAGITSVSLSDDFSGVSELVKERCVVWRAHHTTRSVKASADLSLLWA